MTTIHDVAQLAGVSVSTVSNVINSTGKFSQKTKSKVEQAILELNYVPNQIARGLKSNRTQGISIICEDVNSPFSNQMIDGICDFAETQRYDINLYNLGMSRKMNKSKFNYEDAQTSDTFQASVERGISSSMALRTNGIIYIGIHPRDVSSVLPVLNIPVVYLYSYTNSEDSCINYDDFQGARIATEYLAARGHRRIAVICGAVDSIPSHRRLLGYQTALMESHLPFHPEYLMTSNWNFEDGYQCCKTLLSLPNPPGAIFAMSDVLAYGAMKYAYENQIRIPEDISIIGFDDLSFSSNTFPGLTSVHVPLFEMGQYTASSLINLIKNSREETNNYTKLFECSITERASVRSLIL